MKTDEEPIWWVLYIYAVFNVLVCVVRLVCYGVALWTAFKTDGSILAGIFVAVIASMMKPISYGADMAAHHRRNR
ncbi:hypothetical protein ACQKEK_09495 [Pseudomonas sp. NPDC077408]